MNNSDTAVSDAIVIFLGFGSSPFPVKDRAALSRRFGLATPELERQVTILLDELNQIDVNWSIYTLATAGSMVEDLLRARHPNLSDAAIRALAWKFTFDWK
jgi:hypothetical protein